MSQLFLHMIERPRRCSHFRWPLLQECGRLDVSTEALGGAGKARQRCVHRTMTQVAAIITDKRPTSTEAPNFHVENGLTDSSGNSKRNQEPPPNITSVCSVPRNAVLAG